MAKSFNIRGYLDSEKVQKKFVVDQNLDAQFFIAKANHELLEFNKYKTFMITTKENYNSKIVDKKVDIVDDQFETNDEVFSIDDIEINPNIYMQKKQQVEENLSKAKDIILKLKKANKLDEETKQSYKSARDRFKMTFELDSHELVKKAGHYINIANEKFNSLSSFYNSDWTEDINYVDNIDYYEDWLILLINCSLLSAKDALLRLKREKYMSLELELKFNELCYKFCSLARKSMLDKLICDDLNESKFYCGNNSKLKKITYEKPCSDKSTLEKLSDVKATKPYGFLLNL